METDGKVRAIVGGPDYGESQFNRATHAKRQPGSSFKVYVYATAMENGYTPDTIVRDGSRSCGNWSPSNYGGGGGSGARMPLWSGTRQIAEYGRDGTVVRGRARQGHRDDQAARHRRRQEDLLDGARRRRHHGSRAHRRLRDLRQRRQAGPALWHTRHHDFEGRPSLFARTRRAAAAASRQPPRRGRDEHDVESRRDRRHRRSRPVSTSPTSPARPAHRPVRRTRGSLASRASTSPASGSATTTTIRCAPASRAAIRRRRSGTT